MVSSNKLYRKEDILQMEKSDTNPGFGKGKGGQSSYSIWLWKGGGKMSTKFPNGTCRHKWQREIFEPAFSLSCCPPPNFYKRKFLKLNHFP